MSGLLCRAEAALLVVDVQERFAPVIADWPAVVERCARLIRIFRRLELPVHVTEQYPQGLGRTTAELREALGACAPPAKMSFSVCGPAGDGEVLRRLHAAGRRHVVLCGVETHVCVLQTAFDLAAVGYNVFPVADAVGSRSREHHAGALARMGAAGMPATNHESVLFELLRTAAAPEFKELSRLVR
jgi:nicotinamidase-related amidase